MLLHFQNRPELTVVYLDRLDALRLMYQAGELIGCPAALHLCVKYRVDPVPDWVLCAAAKMCLEYVRGCSPINRGRASSIVGRHRQNMIHLARQETVLEIRDNRVQLAEELSKIANLSGPQALAMREHLKNLKDLIGKNNEVAFECASILLKGTYAEGQPGSIKRSFDLVQRESRDPCNSQ